MNYPDRADLIIRGGTVVLESEAVRADVVVQGEIISGVVPTPSAIPASVVVDADGCIVLPGSIDTHTHINWPWASTTTADTFESASQAALTSGTTTVIDFVPMQRGSSAIAAAERRLRAAEGRMVVDYSFHPILNSSHPALLADIPELINLGLASFKMYTTYQENLVDDGDALRLIEAIAAHGGLPGFHAENDAIIRHSTQALVAAGTTTWKDFPRSRPPIAEAEAISMVALFASQVQSPAYIFHVSGSEEALAVIAQARANGVAISGETCTHYLAFDDSAFVGPEPWRFGITPPIRASGTADRLWSALRSGMLGAVASDHCAYRRSDKQPSANSFVDVPAGGPGIEIRYPLVISEALEHQKLDLIGLAMATSTRPARLLGLYPRKGVIRLGSDADLVILDPNETWALANDYGGTTDYSLYAGRSFRGRVRSVVARGRLVVDHGRLSDDSRRGRFLARRINLADFEAALVPQGPVPV